MSIKPIVSALSAAIFLSACGGGGSGDTNTPPPQNTPQTGSLSLAITDAPVDDLYSVVVVFDGVEIKPADGSEILFEFDEPKSIDLLTLQGENVEPLLSSEEVPAGDYNWVRLLVTATEDGTPDSYVTLEEGGKQIELDIPSGLQSGLKLVSGFTVAQGGTHAFTIDFDLSKSITKPASANQTYKLKPALRLVDNSEVGNLTVTVNGTVISQVCDTPDENAGAVYLWSGADAELDLLAKQASAENEEDTVPTSLQTTAAVDPETGTATIGFITEGDYTVSYTCNNLLDSIAGVDTTGITLEEGQAAEDLIVFHDTQNVTIVAEETAQVTINEVAAE